MTILKFLLSSDPIVKAGVRSDKHFLLRGKRISSIRGNYCRTKSQLQLTTATTIASSSFFLSYMNKNNSDFIHCEAPVVLQQQAHNNKNNGTIYSSMKDNNKTVVVETYKSKLKRLLRITHRLIKLAVLSTPLVLLYPFARLQHLLLIRYNSDCDDNEEKEEELFIADWWMQYALYSCERAGAAVIKCMQWASSRPDLFGHQFCNVFSKLQDHATPHAIQYTHQLMREAYGPDWTKDIQLKEIIGSGCIGQVYKGTARVMNDDSKLPVTQDVAIKVMHPQVVQAVETDLDLFSFIVNFIQGFQGHYFDGLKWMNLPGILREIGTMLHLQLDFRVEARNLDRFNENFSDYPKVEFPKVLHEYPATQNVLVETFCEGIPVTEFVRRHKSDETLMKSLCDVGIEAMCKMIFEHNFIHGDLHPGNIMVNPQNHKFIFLDAGLVTQYNDHDRDIMIGVITSFIRRNGRRAGELMLLDSNTKLKDAEQSEVAINEEAYINKIKALTDAANDSDFFMENLGAYISTIFDAGRTHHILMNPAFVSMMMAVKIQEGVALMLSREAKVWRIANPIIIREEMKRKITHAFG